MFQTGFRNNHKWWDCQTKLDFDVKGEIWELPCLLNTEEKQSCRTSHSERKLAIHKSWNSYYLSVLQWFPSSKGKWAHSDRGFSEHFILIRGRGSARVAGDICSLSSSTWLGTSLPAHGQLSEINMRRNSQAQYRLLLFLHDVYASH